MKNTIKKALGLALLITFTSSFSQLAYAQDDTEVNMEISENKENKTNKEVDLSHLNVGSFKSYMDYRAITSVGSLQHDLQQVAYTGEYGIRTVNGRYLVAVAATFGTVGDDIDIVLEDGKVLECTIGDIKAYTDLLGGDGSLVEFIVDSNSIPKEVSLMGTFGEIFPGNVVLVK